MESTTIVTATLTKAVRPGIPTPMAISAPPPAATLSAVEAAGFDVTHVYGLTEIYGPAVVNAWQREWSALAAGERAQLNARQGVAYHVQAGLMVADPATMPDR